MNKIETGSVPTQAEIDKIQADTEAAAYAESLKQGKVTTLVADGSKTVKIRALRKLEIEGKIAEPGGIIEVSEKAAAEAVNTRFKGNYDFTGERGASVATRHQVQRAEYVR